MSNTSTAAYWNGWAPAWDAMLRLAGLEWRYRKEGVSVLNLKKGMTVLDIACGTGLDFPHLYKAVGPKGRIIAVDISPSMLERAKRRALENKWHNFEFVLGDVSKVRLPKADAAAAFWCMISIPDYRDALRNVVSSLRTGGGLAVLDFKLMEGFPGIPFNPVFQAVCGLTNQDATRKPWLDMKRLLGDIRMREWKFGGLLMSDVYLAWGRKK